ncbi:MAG: cytochrome b/b6 domain-containing protein [Alsobacter sp.]
MSRRVDPASGPPPEGPVLKSLVWRDSQAGYGRVSRILHWVSAGLLLASFALAWSWDLPGRGPLQASMVNWHRTVGLTILALTLARVAWRMSGRRPVWPLPAWARILSRSVQILVVSLLLAAPLLGWAYSNAGGLDVTVAGWPLPALLPRDQYLAELSVAAHEWSANVLLVLVALHAAGAIRHMMRPGDPLGRAMGSPFRTGRPDPGLS